MLIDGCLWLERISRIVNYITTMTPEPDSRGKRAKEFTSWPVRELFGCPQMFILQSKCFVCLVCLWWAHLQDRQEQEGVDVLQQRQHCVLCFDHVRPVHLLTAAGEGTLGPDRAFPLPPVSVKPLFITTRGKERRTVWVFAFLWSYLNITDKSWMEMDGERMEVRWQQWYLHGTKEYLMW